MTEQTQPTNGTVAEDTATCREIGIEAHIASDAPAAIAHVTWDR